jgi:hypothetical protein
MGSGGAKRAGGVQAEATLIGASSQHEDNVKMEWRRQGRGPSVAAEQRLGDAWVHF